MVEVPFSYMVSVFFGTLRMSLVETQYRQQQTTCSLLPAFIPHSLFEPQFKPCRSRQKAYINGSEGSLHLHNNSSHPWLVHETEELDTALIGYRYARQYAVIGGRMLPYATTSQLHGRFYVRVNALHAGHTLEDWSRSPNIEEGSRSPRRSSR